MECSQRAADHPKDHQALLEYNPSEGHLSPRIYSKRQAIEATYPTQTLAIKKGPLRHKTM